MCSCVKGLRTSVPSFMLSETVNGFGNCAVFSFAQKCQIKYLLRWKQHGNGGIEHLVTNRSFNFKTNSYDRKE